MPILCASNSGLFFECDSCGSKIESQGTVLHRPETSQYWFTHKRCNRDFRNRIDPNPDALLSFELSDFLAQLTENARIQVPA